MDFVRCRNLFLNREEIVDMIYTYNFFKNQMPKIHGKTETVKVVVRCRPANDKEIEKNYKIVVKVDE